MIDNLEELQKQFRDRAKNLGLRVSVLMDGDFNAEIAIIGEGPGQDEVNDERNFIGSSGKLLWNTLRPQGILRTDCYVTNVSKRQISLAKNTRHPIEPSEWFKWREMLIWELSELPNLKYIFCMGNAGISALFGFDGITKYRGSVYKWTDPRGRELDVVVAFNPAYVIRELNWEIVFQMDCRTLGNVVKGDFEPYIITKHINPSLDDAVDWIRMMKASTAPVSYDIETPAGFTGCFGLANQGHEAMCINLRTKYDNRFGLEQEAVLWREMQELFDEQEIIAQNGNFDCHWNGYHDFLEVRNGFDTLLAHHTLYPSLPHSLGFLTSQYTTHPFYKDDVDEWREGGDIDAFWRYNATDAAITWECARKLSKELKQQGLHEFFMNHVMRLDKHLVQSTVEGMKVDMSVKSQVADNMTVDVDAIEERFLTLVAETFPDLPYYKPNIRSNNQMRNLFIDKLKAFSSTGAVDKIAREKMKADVRTSQEARQLLFLYDEFQREDKFRSTYANMRIDKDGRFRTTWKQQGVVSAPGRLSSASTLWNTGGNAQNQSERSKEFYTADDGTVVVYIDGSQAEARVVGITADIVKWQEDFERARLTGTFDAHRSLAADMYHLPYDDIPSDDWETDEDTGLKIPTIRYKAKRCRHGLNYRMSWSRLAETAKLNMFEAKKAYILYHNMNPEIRHWWDDLEKIAKKERELWTSQGRRYKILERINDESLESIVAFEPQSTIGDLLRKIWYQSVEDDEWDNSKMRIKLNVHDALIGIATPDKAKTALKIMKKYLEKPFQIETTKSVFNRVYGKVGGHDYRECIIPGDVAISEPDEFGVHRWSTLKKIKGFGK